MEAGEDILETEEFFELVEETAGTTHQRWRIGNRSGHQTHHARILRLL